MRWSSLLPRYQAIGAARPQQITPTIPRIRAVVAWLLAFACGGCEIGIDIVGAPFTASARAWRLGSDGLELVREVAQAGNDEALPVERLHDAEDGHDQPGEAEHREQEQPQAADMADDRRRGPEERPGDEQND